MLSSKSVLVLALMMLAIPSVGAAHGGVVEEDDLCVIKIGYLTAHFKIYVPDARQHDQFCEDIPVRGESLFVMEYLHDGLSRAAIDFRIIRNVTGKGTFARLEDVHALGDLEPVTVRYEPPRVVPDVYTLLNDFETDGEYIGIVSATAETDGKVHTAVFPFEVGYTGIGYWPWVLAAIVILQLNYWLMSRRRARRAAAGVAVVALALTGMDAYADQPPSWLSRDGRFVLRFEADIDPLTINRIHAWTIVITRPDGDPVDHARIDVSGGMPLHDHGLPTAPVATPADGNGRYRVNGMRFHMEGGWEIEFRIDDGSNVDVVTVRLTLSPG